MSLEEFTRVFAPSVSSFLETEAVVAEPLDAADAEAAAADRFRFEALKYVGGVKQETYQAACEARGLLQDDKEWREVLDSARVVECRASKIRELYVYIVLYNAPQNPTALFDEFWPAMDDDFDRELRGQRREGAHEQDELTPLLISSIGVWLSGLRVSKSVTP